MSFFRSTIVIGSHVFVFLLSGIKCVELRSLKTWCFGAKLRDVFKICSSSRRRSPLWKKHGKLKFILLVSKLQQPVSGLRLARLLATTYNEWNSSGVYTWCNLQSGQKLWRSNLSCASGIYDLPFNWAWTKHLKHARYQQ